MIPEDRQNQILRMLETEGSVVMSELVARFAVSEMTIRRDLDALESKGLLRRAHGGAVSTQGRSYEPPILTRTFENQAEKQRIGRAAAEMIHDGDSIALDVGTTTLEIAKQLTEKSNLTIVTASLHIANVLARRPNIRVILTGGILRPVELSLVGHLAEQTFGEFYVDKLFLGVGGIDFQAGLTEFNLEDALVKKMAIRNAKEIIAVVDSSKFGRVAFAEVAPLHVLTCIISDDGLDPATRSQLENQAIPVVLA